jgi:predicted DCC family thiol-disulfide oxidoreductase YuxK
MGVRLTNDTQFMGFKNRFIVSARIWIGISQQGLLDKISVPLRYKSFHLIFPDGETKSGSDALLELSAILPGGKIISPIINYFPGCKSIVRFIYNKLSTLHNRGSCHINNINNINNIDDRNNNSNI